MIDWPKSNLTLETVKKYSKIIAICDKCHIEVQLQWVSYNHKLKKPEKYLSDYLCKSCVVAPVQILPANHTIDIIATEKLLKRSIDTLKFHDNIIITCNTCKKGAQIKFHTVKNKKTLINFKCSPCKRIQAYGIPENHIIDIEATEKLLNKPLSAIKLNDYIIIICQACHQGVKQQFSHAKAQGHLTNYTCRSCSISSLWENNEQYRNNHINGKPHPPITEETKQKLSTIVKERWQNDPEYRQKCKDAMNAPEFKAAASQRSQKLWADPIIRKKVGEIIKQHYINNPNRLEEVKTQSKANWQNPEYIKKHKKPRAKCKTNKSVRSLIARNIRQLMQQILTAATRRDKVVSVDLNYLMELWHINNGLCKLSGLKMSQDNNDLYKVSLDRIDSSKDYIKGNVQLVCQFWNYAKNAHTNDNIELIINKLKNNDKTIVEDNKIEHSLRDNLRLNQLNAVNYDDERKEFDIDIQYLLDLYKSQNGICPMSDFQMLSHGPQQASIDRINNKLGHIKGNIRLVCQFVNLGKRHYSDSATMNILIATKTTQIQSKPQICHQIDFKNLKINDISLDQAEQIITPYHYAHKIGNGGTYYGLFCENTLIAACVFSHPTRQESYTRLGLTSKEMLELSRFCIHPKYQVKNLASWFISRCVKRIKQQVPDLKYLVSFADSTHGHIGIIYRASNWISDGIIKANYEYVHVETGKKLHKKVIWNKAKAANKMGELQYAELNGFKRLWGTEKYRYLWKY